jgi:EmrB/QacA subfamily drug resistance transporter
MSTSATRDPTAACTTSVSAASAGRHQAARVHRATLPVVLTGVFMAALDFFIVNVAIPSAQRDLRASAMAIEWVVAGYGLAYGVALITGGRLGDMYGRRRMLGLGLAMFTLASLACGIAATPGVLVGARVAQGVAAALLTPQVLAIIRTTFAGPAQARAFSAYALTMGVAAVFGQLLGGLIIQADLFGLGWRMCFLINIPIGMAALGFLFRVVPETRAPGRVRVDLPGVVLVTAALVAVILPLIEGRGEGWPLWTWLSLGASILLFAAFGASQRWRARTGRSPLVDLSLFRQRAFTFGLLAQLVFWMGQASFFLVLALYLQQGRSLSALQAGLVFVAIGAGYLATSTNAHRLAARWGRQTLAVGGLAIAFALVLLHGIVTATGHTGHIAWLAPALVIDGVGMGMAVAPLATTVLSRVPAHQAGAAGAILATAQQVGNALGVAIIGIVFYAGLGQASHLEKFPAAFNRSVVYLIVVEIAFAAFVQLLPRRAKA